ncbi:MAG: Uma2 family endonuclease, partial [Bryobacteraceae bacterium]
MSVVDVGAKPLIAGERMTREEFIGRWELLPGVRRAELVGGIVYLPSPVSRSHSAGLRETLRWLSHYELATPGCELLPEASWLMLGDVPQPDVSLRIRPEFGGQSGNRGNLAAGAPELVVEVSITSEPVDLGVKKSLYQRAGVLEYIIVTGSEVIWHRRERDRYVGEPSGPEGVHRSAVFPGLWLDPQALVA